jgi:GTP-binding protein
LPVEFRGSFPDPLHPLTPPAPEFALLGRSNVGKSTLLNALVGRPALARVSATPGKTQLVNAFELPGLYLLDLPGYGYARTGQETRRALRALVAAVLEQRTSLEGVIWLLDIRHPPSEDDLAFQELLASSGRNVLAVLTKADKLAPAARARAAKARQQELGLAADQIQVVSSRSGLGIADLGASLLAAAREES